MEPQIILRLIDILKCDENKSAPASKASCMRYIRYILGEKLGEQLSDSYIEKLYSGTAQLSSEKAQLLLFSKNWSPERFKTICPKEELDLNNLLDKLCKLYNELGFHEINSKDVNLLIKQLLLFHFFGTFDQDLIFPSFNAKNCGYYSEPNQYLDAVSYLKQNNLLFICGAPGTGKSELAKYIALSEHSFRNIGWVEAVDGSVSLNDQLGEIPFPQSSTNGLQTGISRICDIFNRLKRETKTALLIIDLPFISNDDFEIIEKELNGLDIRIIFTTLTTDIPHSFSKISLDNQSISLLSNIFYNIVETEYFTDSEFEVFTENISHNPLIVTLAAKTIKRSPSIPAKSTWLDSSRWIMKESGLKTVHTAYKDIVKNKSSYNILSLMSRLLFYYPHSFLENTANKLSVWCRQPISKDFLSNYFSNEEINDALTYGILEYASPDKQYLKMPNILSYTIWEMYPVQYDDYYDKICEFIDSFKFGKDQKLSYKTLYTVIENMIFRFHYQITFLPSRITRDQRDCFKHWNSQLILIAKRLIRMGNYELSKKIYCNLYKYETRKEKNLILASEKLITYISVLNIPLHSVTSDSYTSIFDQLIKDLNTFKTLMANSSSSPKKTELEQLYDFMQFIVIEILDMLMRMASNKSLDFIDKPASTDFNPVIPRSILTLLTKEYQCYYCILNDFLTAVFHHNREHYKEANTKYSACKDNFLPDSDLSLKLQLYYLFFTLIMGWIATRTYGNATLYASETVSYFNDTYNLLSETLSNKHWSWDTIFLYAKYRLILYAIYSCTPYAGLFQKVFESAKTDLIKLSTEQIPRYDSQAKEIMEILHTFPFSDIK